MALTTSPPPEVAALLEKHSGIKFATRTSEEYPHWRVNYVSNPALPLIILRPQSAEDVAAVVSHCVAQKLDFVVRTGGHDLSGRTTVQDAITIDMRDICHVRVSSDKKTAKIGGGILHRQLVDELVKEQLITPTGVVGSVGYVGWATLGGYGPYSPMYGLGCDQIVGAEVVTAKGELVDASDRMLKGIRGAGGNLGVITEFTIKVYPCEEIYAGTILYDSSDLRKTVKNYWTSYAALLKEHSIPTNLYLQPSVFCIPTLGPTLISLFTWNGPNDDSAQKWLKLVSDLAPVMNADVQTKTPAKMLEEVTAMLPSTSLGRLQTVSLDKVTDQAIDVLAKHLPQVPHDPTTGFSVHQLIPASPSIKPGHSGSVFGCRTPHLVLELLGIAATKEMEVAATKWAKDFRDELKDVDGALEYTYFSLTPDEDIDLAKIYGDKVGEMKALKDEFDPKRVFKRALPEL